MKTELDWPETRDMTSLRLNDRLAIESATGRAISPDQPIDAAMSRETFQRFLAFHQRDEDRRLSAAAAFFMFLFGVGCGAVWTVILIWLFSG